MNAIHYLTDRVRNLPEKERDLVGSILESLAGIVDNDAGLTSLESRLSSIDKYLKTKLKNDSKGLDAAGIDYLRFVRNNVMHGASRVPEDVLDKAMIVFWRILSKSAAKWVPEKLNHLLSYALGMKEQMALSIHPHGEEVVLHYKKIFLRMPRETRRHVFSQQLLPTIYNTEEFRGILRSEDRG